MSPTRFRFLLILAIAHLLLCFQVLAQTPSPSSTPPTPKLSLTHRVKYLVTIDESRPHSLLVEMTISNPGSQLNVGIPAWCPGFYQILQYQKAIERLTASDETGSPLTIKHDKIRNWQISGLRKEAKEVVFRYEVKAIDRGLGFFGSMLNLKRRIAYINGASAFMFVNGDSQSPVSLELSLPNGWKVATPLEASEEESLVDSKNGAHIKLIAKNYEELIDCPLQLGSFQSFDFSASNASNEETNSARPQFQCVLVGNQKADIPKVRTALSKICRAAIDVFKMTPFHKYVFFYHIGESGFEGGLEHRSSTVIHLADPLLEGDDDEFLTTTSHEFFHAWNVKYLRPIGLGPFDLTKQVRTSSLWWAEGVTDYYADLLLFRAGIRDRAWFLKQIQEHIAALDNNPARNRVSLEEASRKSWEGESEGFGGLSYYLKGGLAGFYFDLSLREQTKGAKTLDDVMREMVDVYGKKDEAYPEDAIISISRDGYIKRVSVDAYRQHEYCAHGPHCDPAA